jgi:hypothetical protein
MTGHGPRMSTTLLYPPHRRRHYSFVVGTALVFVGGSLVVTAPSAAIPILFLAVAALLYGIS